jgi:thioredoxin 1
LKLLVHIATLASNTDKRSRFGFAIRRMSMATAKVTTATFDAAVLKSDVPVVVDFWAEWCGPCRMIAPALEEISNEMAGKISVVKVNIDEEPELGAKYGVRSIPTLLIFKGGEQVSNMVGASPKSKMASWIASAA